jgi:hypothetical protein
MAKDKPKKHEQYNMPPQAFDAFNKDLPVQEALGSKRQKTKQEAGDIRSTNWKPGVSGWRLTPSGLELGDSSGTFPAGSITFTDIQNISTDKILGRDTAGSGSIEQLGLGSGLSISGGNLNATVTQYTDENAQDAVGNSVGNGLDYDDPSGVISVDETELAHNSIGSLQGGTSGQYYHLTSAQNTTVGTLAASTYTPTRSAESNIDGTVTMTEAQYLRVGATVSVSGRFTADATAAGLASFEITLPVASNLGAVEDVAGVAFSVSATTPEGGEIIGVVANDTAKIQWIAVDTASRTWSFTFTYQVI